MLTLSHVRGLSVADLEASEPASHPRSYSQKQNGCDASQLGMEFAGKGSEVRR